MTITDSTMENKKSHILNIQHYYGIITFHKLNKNYLSGITRSPLVTCSWYYIINA